MREIIEFASADEAAPPIDLNTLVHMLLSDEWLLYDQSSPSACGGRALAQGKIYHQDGTMVAAVMQEGLTRYRRGSTAATG